MSDSTTKFHPALSISNVKSLIPITLDHECGLYHSWVTLFQVQARVHNLMHHIIPPTADTEKAKIADLKKADPDLFNRLDAVVLQWIYATISTDLLHAILVKGDTAAKAWTRLEQIFHDNKGSRATHLEEELADVRLENFPNAEAYCNHVKSLADRLADVEAPVSDSRLVLRLIGGLPEAYAGTVDYVQNQDPLPSFESVRSRIKLAERTIKHRASKDSSSSALLISNGSPAFTDHALSPHSSSSNNSGRYTTNQKNKKKNQGKNGNQNRNSNRGGSGGDQASSWTARPLAQQAPWQQFGWPWQQWAPPPCPYPAAPWQPQSRPGSQQGILGARPPQQAYMSTDYSVPSSSSHTNIEAAMHTLGLNPPNGNWYMDTGASSHMTSEKGTLSSYVNSSNNHHRIVVGNGHLIPIHGYGHTTFAPPHPPLTLKNVLHAPHLIKNLISVRKFTTDNSVSIEFDPLGFCVKDLRTGTQIMRCNSLGDLYPLSSTRSTTSPSHSAFTVSSSDLWHSRLGHPGAPVLRSLYSKHSIPCNSFKQSFCSSCPLGKQIKMPFFDSMSHTVSPFDIVHSDLWTSPVASSNGHRYYVLFLDDYSKFLWTFPISNKSDVFRIFTIFHRFVQTQFHKHIKTIQCDNGKEFDNSQFHSFAQNHGIQFRFSCPYTSSQNGKAERHIRSINNVVRTLLTYASIPSSFWHHALAATTYLINILPSKVLDSYSPTHVLYHKAPTYTHLRVFGCLCFPLFPSSTIHKLQARSTPCVFLGYPSDHRGYKCYDISSRKIFVARHVVFDEAKFPFSQVHKPVPNTYSFLDTPVDPFLLHQISTAAPSRPPSPAVHSASPGSVGPQPAASPTASPIPMAQPGPTNAAPSPASTPPPPQLPPTRHRIPNPKFYGPDYVNLASFQDISPLPRNPLSALSDPNWKNAMIDEFTALIDNKTWELVPKPANANIIRSMWIFRHKKNSDGSFERHKARLVGDGRSQQKGVDCDETFSPVVKPATIRTVLSIAVSRSWPIHQLDVKNAFLHGNLSETVYMHQPLGFRDSRFPNHVCLLKKSLYGLKQAPRAWYQRFADHIASIGFSHSTVDHSLFIYRRDNDIAYILLYVDDIILTASTDTLRQSIMSFLSAEFAMKDLGPLSYFLGIAVTRRADGLFLSQQQYAAELLERAGMSHCNSSPTPIDTKPKLSAAHDDPFDDPTKYRQLAGALQYLTFTRPDISYAVQQVCLHMHDPRIDHMNALKRILRYIHGTIDLGLHLYKSSVGTLTSYTDADWGGCPDTRRSTSGYCVFLGDNLISWSSKRQPTLSRSSAEAEYRGVANVVSESCWLRNLLLELHFPVSKATLVYCDNVSAIYLSGNPVQHQRTKHIEMDIHFVREKVARGEVRVLHVPSRYQIADIFTKGLPRVLFDDFRDNLSVRKPPA